MRTYANLGRWTHRWDKDKSSRLQRISLSKQRSVRVLNKTSFEDGTLLRLVQLAVDPTGTLLAPNQAFKDWELFLRNYIGALHIMTHNLTLEPEALAKMQELADAAFEIYVSASALPPLSVTVPVCVPRNRMITANLPLLCALS